MIASTGIVQQRERRSNSRFRPQNSFAQEYSRYDRQLGQHMSLFTGESAVEATAAPRNPEVPVRGDDLRAADSALPDHEGRRNDQRVKSEKLIDTARTGRSRRRSLPERPAHGSKHPLRPAVEHLATAPAAAGRRYGTAETRSNVRVCAVATSVRYQERPQGGVTTMGGL